MASRARGSTFEEVRASGSDEVWQRRERSEAIGMLRIVQEVRVTIASQGDIISARHRGRLIAEESGFRFSEPTLIAAAVSELARNILRFATQGEIIFRLVENELKHGMEVIAVDGGPGIPDVSRAMQAGYSTSGGLGLGLSGVSRLMDEVEIVSRVGTGTTVTSRKWMR